MKHMFNRFLELSVKRKVQSIFIAAILAFLITISFFFYYLVTNQFSDAQNEQNLNTLKAAEKNIYSIFESIDNTSRLIMFNGSVSSYLHLDRDMESSSSQNVCDEIKNIGDELLLYSQKIDSFNDQIQKVLYESDENIDDTEFLKIISENFTGYYNALESLSKNISDDSQAIADKEVLSVSDDRKIKKLNYDLQANYATTELYTILDSFPYYYSVYIFWIDNFNNVDINSIKTEIGVTKPTRADLNRYWKQKVSGLNGRYIVTPNNNQFESDDVNLVLFMRAINDINTQKPIGMLVINFTESLLRQAYSQYSDESTAFAVIDDNGNCFSSDINDELLAQILKEREKTSVDDNNFEYEKYLVSSKRIKNSDMTLICCSKYRSSSALSNEIVISVVYIIIILILIMIIINIFLNKYITTPLTKLSESMEFNDEGYPLRVDLDTYDDEIGCLKDCYNDMVVKINKLIVEVVEKEKQRQQAEMNVIQEQIKPHFLYNTLETIGCMALQNSREEVYDVVETLGSFYRNFLSKGNENITIAQEVAIVRDYMKLLKIRYDDLFDDEYEIQEDLNSLIILKLILQPLVENAIYHGIRPKGEHGLIKISIFSIGPNVHIKVYDTGVGMSQMQIDQLLNGEAKRSFGFQATIDRIRNFYQAENVARIRSVEGEFCEIEIIIPFDNMR